MKILFKTLIVFAILTTVNPLYGQSKSDYFYNKTQEIAAEANIPAIQLYYKNDKTEIYFTTNQSDSLNINANNESIFQMASLSKTVFAYIVMRMYDRGEIDIDQPISNYTNMDKFNDSITAKLITPRMVLCHVAGLKNWATSPSSDSWAKTKNDFILEPGKIFSYSGEAYAYLQRAVEEISGKSLQELAADEVFIPLNMPNSSYGWLNSYDEIAVDGFNRQGDNRGKNRHSSENSAYTLRSNAVEYAKFIDALVKGTGLKKETHELMFNAAVHAVRYHGSEIDCDKNMYWALGIGVEKNNKELGDIYFHWGDNGNFKAMFFIIPSLNAYLVYTTNSGNGHDIVNKIASLYFGTKNNLELDCWINR